MPLLSVATATAADDDDDDVVDDDDVAELVPVMDANDIALIKPIDKDPDVSEPAPGFTYRNICSCKTAPTLLAAVLSSSDA